jgi:hypothetical protein
MKIGSEKCNLLLFERAAMPAVTKSQTVVEDGYFDSISFGLSYKYTITTLINSSLRVFLAERKAFPLRFRYKAHLHLI